MSDIDHSKVPEPKSDESSLKSQDNLSSNGMCTNRVVKSQNQVASGLVSPDVNDKNTVTSCTVVSNSGVECVESENLKDVEDADFTIKKHTNGLVAEEVAKSQMQVASGLVSPDVIDKNTVNICTVVSNSEVEYVESENLKDVKDVDSTIKKLINGLESKDWFVVCESLNNVRRLALFHMEAMRDMLNDVLPLIVKSLKNPRSGVCKTAIMTSSDLFSTYKDSIIDSLDPLLMQLLLKASQDKKFVCEAAERTLSLLTRSVSPILLLPKLRPYLQNKNPRIRARAALCFSQSVPRLGVEGIHSYGIDKLIQVAASQLSDQLPESREAARALLLDLQTMYEESSCVTPDVQLNSWEQFCHINLSPLNAQAVLRVTSVRGALILGK